MVEMLEPSTSSAFNANCLPMFQTDIAHACKLWFGDS
jgi:hypothetical protein